MKGKRIGLITNHTGLDSEGTRTLDLLSKAEGIRLAAVFSPEHGLYGDADAKIASHRDQATGLPVTSLYGDHRRPTPEMFMGLDAIVFDIQDAGVRFYTYITTMGYAMEAAARQRIPFYVLDRPNPLTASTGTGAGDGQGDEVLYRILSPPGSPRYDRRRARGTFQWGERHRGGVACREDEGIPQGFLVR